MPLEHKKEKPGLSANRPSKNWAQAKKFFMQNFSLRSTTSRFQTISNAMLELFSIALRYEGIVFPEKHCALGLWHGFAILHDPGLVPGLDCYIYVLRGHLKLLLPTPTTFYK